MHTKPIPEISPAEMDTYFRRRQPFIVRGWQPEIKNFLHDPEWKAMPAMVVPLTTEAGEDAVVSSRRQKIDKTNSQTVFDLIADESNNTKYYQFGNDVPQNLLLKLKWPKRMLRGKIYAASKGVVTKSHFDLWDICMLQCGGSKTWWLAPPADYPYMYPSMDSAAGTERRCLVDIHNPDLEQYPLFDRVTFHTVTAHEGDLLYVPTCWWHEVRTDSFSVSINAIMPRSFWFYYQACLRWYFDAFRSVHIYKTSTDLPKRLVAMARSQL